MPAATKPAVSPPTVAARPAPSRGWGVAIVLGSAAILAAHARYYFPFLADDALISLRYVQRLLDGKGLTWTDGPPVEGYSNLLWILLTAALGATGLDLITVVRILGFAATMGVVLALAFGFLRGAAVSVAITAIVTAIWVLAGPSAAWALAGLEQPLVACLLAWTLALVLQRSDRTDVAPRAFLLPGILLGGLCLTRPDSPLFVGVFAFWLLLQGRLGPAAIRSCAWLLLVPGCCLIAQQLFRLLYYGEWLPNVAHAKIGPSATHFVQGLKYVVQGVAALRPIGELSLLAIGFLCCNRRTRSRGLLLLALCVVWSAYLGFIGGDIFPAWRHMLPVIVFFLVADILALEQIFTLQSRRVRRWALLLPVILAWFVFNQFRNEMNQVAKTERWEWNGQVVGLALKRGFAAQQPTIAVTAAGAVPYWSELPALDLLGLSDAHIARTRPPGWGQGRLGHEVGDPAYAMSRAPDLILFGTPGGREPSHLYAGLTGMPEFTANYDRCNFAVKVPYAFNSRMYVHRNSTKIGIVRRPGEIFVPPYLLNGRGHALAELDTEDRFYVMVAPGQMVGIQQLELPAGRWTLVEPQPNFRLRISAANSMVDLAEESCGGTPCLRVTTAGPHLVLLESTASAPVPIYGLRLKSE